MLTVLWLIEHVPRRIFYLYVVTSTECRLMPKALTSYLFNLVSALDHVSMYVSTKKRVPTAQMMADKKNELVRRVEDVELKYMLSEKAQIELRQAVKEVAVLRAEAICCLFFLF